MTSKGGILRQRSISDPTLPAMPLDTDNTGWTSFRVLTAVTSSGDHEDLSDDEDENSVKQSRMEARSAISPYREEHAYTEWAAKEFWSYYSTSEDLNAIHPGIAAYRRPQLPHFNLGAIRGPGWENVPGHLMGAQYSIALPIVNYNAELNRFEISSHSKPWSGDIRSDPAHPDYLPPDKLCQYQACEYFGFLVFRHDRQVPLSDAMQCNN